MKSTVPLYSGVVWERDYSVVVCDLTYNSVMGP